MMQLFDVYSLMNVIPENTRGYYKWDINGKQYLDSYGGHSPSPLVTVIPNLCSGLHSNWRK